MIILPWEKRLLVKHRLSLQNFPTVSCQNTCNVYTSVQMSREPNTGSWQVWHFFDESNQNWRELPQILADFPQHDGVGFEQILWRDSILRHPRRVWWGDILRKQKPTAKRLGCYKSNPSLDTLLNKSARFSTYPSSPSPTNCFIKTCHKRGPGYRCIFLLHLRLAILVECHKISGRVLT